MSELAQPIYFLEKNPHGWFESSLPQLKERAGILWEAGKHRENLSELSWDDKHAKLNDDAKKYTEKLWLLKTGQEKIEDVKFSLIIPIHNEGKFLPSALGTLMMSSIPESAHVNICLITNGCTDSNESANIVENFMDTLGDVEKKELSEEELEEVPDKYLHSKFSLVCKGNIHFMHFDTPTPGKSNAINIGNTFAKEHNTIAINLDANSFVEPDGILEMYAKAYETMVANPDGTAIVRCIPSYDFKSKKLRHDNKIDSFVKPIQELTRKEEIVVVGQLIAWNTEWLDKVGGFPNVLFEDYALSAESRSQGLRVSTAEKAHQWSFQQGNIADTHKYVSRLVQGSFQIMDKHPHLKSVIQEDYHFAKNFKDRVLNIGRNILANPRMVLPILIGAIFLESVRLTGKLAYEKNKNQTSWAPIASTKS